MPLAHVNVEQYGCDGAPARRRTIASLTYLRFLTTQRRENLMSQWYRKGLTFTGVTAAVCAAFLGATGADASAASGRPARPADSACITNWEENGSVAVSTCVGWDNWRQFLGCSGGEIDSPMQFGPGIYTGRCPSGQTVVYANVITYL